MEQNGFYVLFFFTNLKFYQTGTKKYRIGLLVNFIDPTTFSFSLVSIDEKRVYFSWSTMNVNQKKDTLQFVGNTRQRVTEFLLFFSDYLKINMLTPVLLCWKLPIVSKYKVSELKKNLGRFYWVRKEFCVSYSGVGYWDPWLVYK